MVLLLFVSNARPKSAKIRSCADRSYVEGEGGGEEVFLFNLKRIFSALMSLWTTPCECKKSNTEMRQAVYGMTCLVRCRCWLEMIFSYRSSLWHS